MDLRLQGKLAVVTGSTKGIGLATARLLDQEGARVVINGRSRESVDQALTSFGKHASGVPADLSTAEGCADFVSHVKALGRPDILVNNMGIFEPKDFFDIPDEDWERFFRTNVMSGVRLARAFMPAMLERGWGRIVFLSSESAVNIPEEMIHYGMTKTAYLSIARGLAQLATGTDVTVNSVLPGPTWSEGVGGFVTELAEGEDMDVEEFKEEVFFEEARPTSILQRFTRPEEIASMIVYLCSPLASATTGGAIRADGGTVRSILP
ncbi:SDR family NAD(P)-dependent oxidoreductase [Desulfohalovibrio reitneri]|uniref:SDR family NAD(P)-dependent oxidoreductase n=1 Tax=Desulfohalovibrio reitneri TaxID=1307759 RepID=UPI0004A7561C|nr:SDR family oxidoreductase [Desulfohalovibrio reitneri]